MLLMKEEQRYNQWFQGRCVEWAERLRRENTGRKAQAVPCWRTLGLVTCCLFYFLCVCVCSLSGLLPCVNPAATKWTVNMEQRRVSRWPSAHTAWAWPPGLAPGPRESGALLRESTLKLSSSAPVITNTSPVPHCGGGGATAERPYTWSTHERKVNSVEEHQTDLKLVKPFQGCNENINKHFVSIGMHVCTCTPKACQSMCADTLVPGDTPRHSLLVLPVGRVWTTLHRSHWKW